MLKLILCVIVTTAALSAQERVVLNTPPPSASEYAIESVSMLWGPFTVAAEGQPSVQTCEITIALRADHPASPYIRHSYTGATACTMLRQLNKANLTVTSLQRRIIERLIADKVIAGAISGTPE